MRGTRCFWLAYDMWRMATANLAGLGRGEDPNPLPLVGTPVIISWDLVTESHSKIGESGAIEVVKYQGVVEREEPETLVLSVDLPPGVTSFEGPRASHPARCARAVREERAHSEAHEHDAHPPSPPRIARNPVGAAEVYTVLRGDEGRPMEQLIAACGRRGLLPQDLREGHPS
jgi:hypothetical protein